jgi:hypothetical protein
MAIDPGARRGAWNFSRRNGRVLFRQIPRRVSISRSALQRNDWSSIGGASRKTAVIEAFRTQSAIGRHYLIANRSIGFYSNRASSGGLRRVSARDLSAIPIRNS